MALSASTCVWQSWLIMKECCFSHITTCFGQTYTCMCYDYVHLDSQKLQLSSIIRIFSCVQSPISSSGTESHHVSWPSLLQALCPCMKWLSLEEYTNRCSQVISQRQTLDTDLVPHPSTPSTQCVRWDKLEPQITRWLIRSSLYLSNPSPHWYHNMLFITLWGTNCHCCNVHIINICQLDCNVIIHGCCTDQYNVLQQQKHFYFWEYKWMTPKFCIYLMMFVSLNKFKKWKTNWQ